MAGGKAYLLWRIEQLNTAWQSALNSAVSTLNASVNANASSLSSIFSSQTSMQSTLTSLSATVSQAVSDIASILSTLASFKVRVWSQTVTSSTPIDVLPTTKDCIAVIGFNGVIAIYSGVGGAVSTPLVNGLVTLLAGASFAVSGSNYRVASSTSRAMIVVVISKT